MLALVASAVQLVPGTGVEPVRPLCRKAADFKSAVYTSFTIRATLQSEILSGDWPPPDRGGADFAQGRASPQVALR